MRRSTPLVTREIYHVFARSIAEFKIFNSNRQFLRIKNAIRYYQVENMPFKLSKFLKLKEVKEKGFNNVFISALHGKEKLVQIICYCIMPTHIHLALKQLKDKGISIFMGNLLNSYSRYFNIQTRRKGPLWEDKFRNVLVETDEQLLHLTRYIHLNSVTAHLVEKPEDWSTSSYLEYLSEVNEDERICEYEDILKINPVSYKNFAEDRISYQRELAKIKHLLLKQP